VEIDINDLAREVTNTIRTYTKKVEEGLEKAKIEVADNTVKRLKKSGDFEDKSGKYRKSWTRKKVGTAQVVYNKRYQLTHLLEHGHAKRGGGRVRAYPHIAPAEEEAIKEFTEKVEKVIKQ
jgi:hypothetical protein